MTEVANPTSSLAKMLGVSQSCSNIVSSSEPIRLINEIKNINISKQTEEDDNESQSASGENDNENESDTENTNESAESKPSPDMPENPKLPFSSFSVKSFSGKPSNINKFNNGIKINSPELLRTKSCPEFKYDDCREFDSFSGKWVDSKGQNVLISPWGVIRYPNNPKLRFEATYLGPNHLSVTFDKDPKRRKFVGKLNHECTLLIWSNDTKWAKKGSKNDPKFHQNKTKRKNSKGNRSNSCLIQ